MNTKEQDFNEFMKQRYKITKKGRAERFLKTYTCPVHNIKIRILVEIYKNLHGILYY